MSDSDSDHEAQQKTKKKRTTKAKKTEEVVSLPPEKPTYVGNLDDEDFTPFPFLKDVDLDAPKPKPTPGAPRKKKLYIPKAQSAAAAVLMALHQIIFNDESKHLGTETTKQDIIDEAEKYTEVVMESTEENPYGGYSSTKTLMTHGLIAKVAGGRRVIFTKKGAFTAIICIARDGLDNDGSGEITLARVRELIIEWYRRELPLEIDEDWVVEQYRLENPRPKKARTKTAPARKKAPAKKKAKETESEEETSSGSDDDDDDDDDGSD